MIKKIRLSAIFIILVSLVFPLTAAEVNPRIMLVLDASGSMWGKLDGKTKIEIARDVIADFLDKLDPNVEIGLVVYGHRRKGDCKDIETLIPIAKGAGPKIIATVNNINPKGKTPLSHAVKHAAQELKHTEMRATVVLVSDGVETCNANPCEIGKELAMSGVDFTAHVIGFDVKGEDQAGLKCLAANTGGIFLPAANAGELREAFTQAAAIAKKAPKPVVEDPGKATLEGPAQVPAGSRFEVKWTGPDSRSDYITIVEKKAKDRAYRNYAYTNKGNPVTITAVAQPGRYELRYIHNHTRKVLARADITVTAVTAAVEGPAEVGAGASFMVKWTGPDNRADFVTIAPKDAPDKKYMKYFYTKNGSPGKLTAPDEPGDYEIRYVMNQSRTVLARAGIIVKAAAAGLRGPSSVAAGSSFQVVAIFYMDIRTMGKNYDRYYERARDEYGVRYLRSAVSCVREPIDVTPVGATLEAAASVQAGSTVEVTWTGPNNRADFITIVPKDAPDKKYLKYSYTKKGSPLTISVPDGLGAYELRYLMGQSRKVLARRDITLTAVTAKISAPAEVAVGTKFRVSWEGPGNKRDYITIVEAGAPDRKHGSYAYAGKGSPVTLKAPKKPGKYELRYVLGISRRILARIPVTVK
jgi:Ca-activated chloride channel family protein